MTASAPPIAAASRPISLRSRLMGLGTIFGKTLRDSRRGMLIVFGFLGVIWLTIGSATASTFGTVETRGEGISITQTLPDILLGLYGGTQPNVVTLGGFANWRYGLLFLLIPGVWSLLALSGTLVNEARRGSLDLVAAAPMSRGRIALELLGGHVAALAVVMLALGLVGWGVGSAFATLTPEEVASLGGTGTDQIPLANALSQSLLMGLVALATGSIAFALAPFVGRGAAAGIAGGLLGGSWVIYGYRESIAAFDAIQPISWFSWTTGHRPLADAYDWPSLVPLVAIVAIGTVVGIATFERRDIGEIGSVRTPCLPGFLRGLRSPFGRSLSDRLVGAIWWGIGLGAFAFAIAASGEQLRESITASPTIRELFEVAFPNIEIDSPGFGLQLGFLAFGYLGAGVAAATLVGGWASDESEGRLEMVLATSTARARWFVQTALGVIAAIAIVALVVAGLIAFGVVTTGEDPTTAALGTGAVALYGWSVAGVAFAFAGWIRSSIGVVVGIVIAVATILLDILVPALQLPDWVHEFALTAHFGEPMVGNWDPVGIAVSLALMVGGVALGAWGFSRRDLRG